MEMVSGVTLLLHASRDRILISTPGCWLPLQAALLCTSFFIMVLFVAALNWKYAKSSLEGDWLSKLHAIYNEYAAATMYRNNTCLHHAPLMWCWQRSQHHLQKMHALHLIVRSYQTNPNWWTVCKLTDQQFLESVKIMKDKERLRNYDRLEETKVAWQLYTMEDLGTE